MKASDILGFVSDHRLIVAIDGPSGAGKGTVARELAKRLNYRHVDTGAMYRAVAWKAVHDRLNLEDEDAVADVAEHAALTVAYGLVVIDGYDVTTSIRTPEIDRASAATARLPKVRAALVARQRKEGHGGGVVMEGRDIGSVVFPNADVKIYLDASPEERARRRAADPAHGLSRAAAASDVASELEARDRSDRTRATSPLTMAHDAVKVDTTMLSIDETVERVLEIIQQVSGARA
jgi:cytidylate kinase